MRAPTVSILIPTYNYARFLPEAIESVLQQDFQDFELLISDDCSADDAAAAAAPYCQRDKRVQFWRNTSNIGMVNNWNLCLKKARGKYIKFIFGDDKLAHPQALSKLVEMLEKNPRATLAASARAIIDENSNFNEVWDGLADGCHNGRQTIARCLLEDRNLVGEPSAVLFRRSDADGGFDPAYRQVPDLAFWFQLLERGDLAYVRQPLCAFRRHPLQQSALNHRAGLARPEHMALMAQVCGRPWLSKRITFNILYGLRRTRLHGQIASTPELLKHESSIAGHLGKFWYTVYLSGHKLAGPFSKLKRSIRKRLVRLGIIVAKPQAAQAAARATQEESSEPRTAPQFPQSVAPTVSRKNVATVDDADAAKLLSV